MILHRKGHLNLIIAFSFSANHGDEHTVAASRATPLFCEMLHVQLAINGSSQDKDWGYKNKQMFVF